MSKKIVKRPDSVKVKDSHYKLVPRSDSWNKKHSALGRIDFSKMLIEFDKTQNDTEVLNVCIHEFLHAIINEYEIDIRGKKEEVLVTKMADGLTDIFVENDGLLDWFQSKIKKIKLKN